ncbi:helix-turn-helix transcriptional regulator [Nisaea nitritireducens]|uniref:helix-turn-helix transcriptional regulator n=1 Tax=Nisaea nitritireducens TaxID=568392 RepID=UPI00186669DE|nr:helix-turn-helix transcriptional regulator [Nisaea nitritireducens]
MGGLSHSLISKIYDTAIDSEIWTETLEQLSLVLNGRHSGIIVVEGSSNLPDISFGSSKWTAEIRARFAAEAAEFEQHAFQELLNREPRRLVKDLDCFGTLEEFTNNPATKFNERHVGTFHRAACRLNDHGAWNDFFAVQYEIGRGPVTDAEIETSTIYLPHVAKAVELSRPFLMLKAMYRAALSVLDKLKIGVLIVEGTDKVIVKNQEAARLLEGPAPISLDRAGRLQFTGPDQGAVSANVSRASATARAEDTFSGSWHLLADPDGGEVIVDIIPLGDPNGELQRGLRAAAVILTDPKNRASISETGMGEVYGLTKAEMEIVSHIFDGMATEHIAETRGTSVQTTRGQIKSALRKTGSGTRVDLVRLATKLNPPVMRISEPKP